MAPFNIDITALMATAVNFLVIEAFTANSWIQIGQMLIAKRLKKDMDLTNICSYFEPNSLERLLGSQCFTNKPNLPLTTSMKKIFQK